MPEEKKADPGGPLARPPIYSLQGGQETNDLSFADLVRLVAEGIMDAQTSLDRAAAQTLVQLANTPVEVVTHLVERIQPDGSVTYETKRGQRTLLELGVLPTFYQFSEATVEVSLDLIIVEDPDSEQPEEGNGGGDEPAPYNPYKPPRLKASTRQVRLERQLQREVRSHSRLTARLVPVPRPLRLDPVHIVEQVAAEPDQEPQKELKPKEKADDGER
jgi:hypothetical protein